jgi:hypothetical protein
MLPLYSAKSLFYVTAVTTTEALEVSHAEKEAAAYNAYLSAAPGHDRAVAWQRYAAIHAQRPQAIIERMELDKGLNARG